MNKTDEVSHPTCGVDGCEKDSEYLLSCGDRCQKHALEERPATVRYCRAVLGEPEVNDE